jgi:hypothetical protein
VMSIMTEAQPINGQLPKNGDMAPDSQVLVPKGRDAYLVTAADLYSNAEVVGGAAVNRQQGGPPLSLVEKPSRQVPPERPSCGLRDGEKGADAPAGSSGCPADLLPPAPRAARRRKAPRVGERRVSSRKSGVARPLRSARPASVRRGGGILFFPRRSGQGRGRCLRQEVPEAIGVGAKSLPRAVAVESVETRCSRPLTLRTFGGRPDREETFDRKAAVPTAPQWFGMFERSSVVLVETCICRSRTKRTRPGRRTRIASEQGSSRGFKNVDEHVRRLPRRPAGAALHPGPRKGARAGLVRWKAPRARARSAALTRIGRHELRRRVLGRSRGSSRRPQEVSEGSTRRSAC